MPNFGDGGPWSGSSVGHPWMGGPAPGHPGWAPFVWGLLPALVFGGLIALIVLLFIRTTREQSWSRAVAVPPAADHAFVEARMRYARSELARDEYLRIVQDLGHEVGHDGAATPPAATPGSPEPPVGE
jgi:uncharacterized membrane protein